VIKLFGPDRVRIGDPDTNWAVWISGMDDIHDQPNAEAALAFAADHNAVACADYDGNPYSPVTYAVVLHQGYAWSSHVEHRAGRDCGVSGCVHCGTDRNITLKTLAERWEQSADRVEAAADRVGEGVLAATRDARGRTYRRVARDLREVLATGRIPHDLKTDAELGG
jgi:hypothetical protein